MSSRLLINLLPLALLVPLLGCVGPGSAEKKKADDDRETANDRKVGSDGLPVDSIASFKAFLKDEFQRIKQNAPHAKPVSGFLADVQKTDSPTSPLLGRCTLLIKFEKTVEETGQLVLTAEFLIHYGWQNSQWVCTDGSFKVRRGKILRDTSRDKRMDTVLKSAIGERFTFKGFDGFISRLNGH